MKKRRNYSNIHEKLDRILELLESEEDYVYTTEFELGCREPVPTMEYMESEGRNLGIEPVQREDNEYGIRN